MPTRQPKQRPVALHPALPVESPQSDVESPQSDAESPPPVPPRSNILPTQTNRGDKQHSNAVPPPPPRPPRAKESAVAEEAANKAQQEKPHYIASIASDNEDQTSDDDVCETPIPEQTNETDQQKPHYTVSIASPENKKRLQKQQQAPNTTGSPTATKSADDEVVVKPVSTKKTAAPCQKPWGIALASLGSVCTAGSAVAAGILLNTFMASSSSFNAAVTSMYNAYPIVTISLAISFVIGAALITVGAHLVCKAGKASQYSVLKPTTDKVETDKHTVDGKPTTLQNDDM